MKPCLVIGSGFHNWVTGKVQHPTDITQWFEPSALSSSKIELHAKAAVMKVLQAQAKEYPCKSGRARFPFDAAFGAVISLNFDQRVS